jgi:hypothetical protein
VAEGCHWVSIMHLRMTVLQSHFQGVAFHLILLYYLTYFDYFVFAFEKIELQRALLHFLKYFNCLVM